jgi:hypothetical protein
MTIQDTLDTLLVTAEKLLDMGERTNMSKVVDGTSIPKILAEYFEVSEAVIRATKIVAQKNVVNRIHYEALWKNPVVLCVAVAGDTSGVAILLDNVKSKIADFAQYVPLVLGVAPRIRAALIITRVEQQPATLAYVATFSGASGEGAHPPITQLTDLMEVIDASEDDESEDEDA